MSKRILDKNTMLCYVSAKSLGLHPELLLDEIFGFRITLGSNNYYFRMASLPFTPSSSAFLSGNKYCVNQILAKAGLPVPKAIALCKKDFRKKLVKEIVDEIKFPMVVKPTCRTALGKDVLCNVNTEEELINHMEKCYKKKHVTMTVEAFHSGLKSYRVHVFFGKVIGIVERTPSHVIGDGISTISDLIDQQNIIRKKIRHKVSLGLMNKSDPEYKIRLKDIGLTLGSVPAKDQYIQLCYNCNSTRGGTMRSLGKNHIHASNAKLVSKASKLLNLNSVGFDVLCKDILAPYQDNQFVIIEANENADVTIHENAMEGVHNPITKTIMKHLIKKHPFYYLKGLYQHAPQRVKFYLRSAFAAMIMFIMIFILEIST